MKVKVIEEFRDKHTGELRRIGDILDITAEREKEIDRRSSRWGDSLSKSPEVQQEEKKSKAERK